MSLFHRCFWNILLVKTNYLVYPYWNIGQKWLNFSQYRGVVGAFSSRFIDIKQHNIFKNAFSQSKVKQIMAEEIFLVFASFSVFLLISISCSFINLLRIKARFINLSQCLKIVLIRSYSGPYFPAVGLNTEYLSVVSSNAGKYGPV